MTQPSVRVLNITKDPQLWSGRRQRSRNEEQTAFTIIRTCLQSAANLAIVEATLSRDPFSLIYLIVDACHSSMDTMPHYTLDVYQRDPKRPGFSEAIGCLHVYDQCQLQLYPNARAKAKQASDAARERYDAIYGST